MSGIREATISALQGAQITRHLGRPTRNAVKKTRKELGIIYAAAKTTHEDFQMGNRFGYAAAVLSSSQFITAFNAVCAVGDELADNWEFLIPQRPQITNPDIDENTTDTERRQMVAEWKEYVEQWERFDAYEMVFKEKVEAAFDSQYFVTLCDDLLGYTQVCVSEMLDHLVEQCLEITDTEKAEKLQAALKPWNPDQDIDAFFHSLDKIQEALDDESIPWPNTQKIIHAMKQMYACNTFDARDMRDWERKLPANKGWIDLQVYFGDLYTDSKKYEKATGGNHGFDSAANVIEQPPPSENDDQLSQQLCDIAIAATADKEHIQQMTNCTDDLLAIIKQQQTQITELMRQNGVLIAKVGTGGTSAASQAAKTAATAAAQAAAKMTSSAAARAGAATAATPNPRATYTPAQKIEAKATVKKINAGTQAMDNTSHVCILCGKHYRTARCFEINANAHLRPSSWRSLFD